jgi:hypothetical protein
MTLPWQDGVTPMTAANMNLLIQGDGTTCLAAIAFRIYYTGSAWTVHVSTGSFGSEPDVALAWSGVSYRLEITLSGLTRPFAYKPACIVSPTADGATPCYIPAASPSTKDLVYVQFYDMHTSALITTEDAQMDFHIIMLGIKT